MVRPSIVNCGDDDEQTQLHPEAMVVTYLPRLPLSIILILQLSSFVWADASLTPPQESLSSTSGSISGSATGTAISGSATGTGISGSSGLTGSSSISPSLTASADFPSLSAYPPCGELFLALVLWKNLTESVCFLAGRSVELPRYLGCCSKLYQYNGGRLFLRKVRLGFLCSNYG